MLTFFIRFLPKKLQLFVAYHRAYKLKVNLDFRFIK
jgi:hypothetical protein